VKWSAVNFDRRFITIESANTKTLQRSMFRGWPERSHFHDLRHTAITRMLEKGISPPLVMKISGHTQHKTFLRYVNQSENSVYEIAPKAGCRGVKMLKYFFVGDMPIFDTDLSLGARLGAQEKWKVRK
jgi:hypothetical protein